ncbi:hypothetical protein [Solilutibacter tolerans]|uniref:Uncharacterized protein n=1 Tax=Solilutibacter tolerans TaxID=1604334 RepID=A0A1N6XDJ6_9GAMM|nr:hypothetical protein [Lysobacter tolerans]SIR00415.1 hypothetical protein SAMN05421546_2207 [Lysobacter tolerans]
MTLPPFRSALIATALITLPASVMATDPLYIAPKLEVAKDSGISAEMLADCPLQQDFAEVLQRALSKQGGTFANGNVPTAKGRSLKVELVDFAMDGNGFIGRRQYYKLKGTLYQDGKKVASFTDRAQFQGGGFATACHEVRMSLRAEAYYIGKWVKNPVDGEEIKHFGE